MPDTIPVGKYYNFDNKNVDVVYNPAKDENKGSSGGGGTVFVDCTQSETSNLIATKTAGEIFEAVESGFDVIFKITAASLAMYMHCISANNSDDGYTFAVVLDSRSGVSVGRFTALNSSDNPVLNTR